MISEQETFSLLSPLSWDLITQLHYAGQVRWIKKQRTQRHPYGWEVRVMVWLAGESKDIVMGVSTTRVGGRGGHDLWVFGNPGVISQIKGMVYGAQAGMGSKRASTFASCVVSPERQLGRRGVQRARCPPQQDVRRPRVVRMNRSLSLNPYCLSPEPQPPLDQNCHRDLMHTVTSLASTT